MKLCLISLILILMIKSSCSWKGNAPGGTQLNIGLIAPHTNFGKREYLRAINSAVQVLQKVRGTKLTFLKTHQFASSNIHFDMMSLTPSPTGWKFKY